MSTREERESDERRLRRQEDTNLQAVRDEIDRRDEEDRHLRRINARIDHLRAHGDREDAGEMVALMDQHDAEWDRVSFRRDEHRRRHGGPGANSREEEDEYVHREEHRIRHRRAEYDRRHGPLPRHQNRDRRPAQRGHRSPNRPHQQPAQSSRPRSPNATMPPNHRDRSRMPAQDQHRLPVRPQPQAPAPRVPQFRAPQPFPRPGTQASNPIMPPARKPPPSNPFIPPARNLPSSDAAMPPTRNPPEVIDLTSDTEGPQPEEENGEWATTAVPPGEDRDQCGICKQERQQGTPVIVLRCNHWFDQECLQYWFNQQDKDERIHTCPTCRKPADRNANPNGNEPNDVEMVGYNDGVVNRVLGGSYRMPPPGLRPAPRSFADLGGGYRIG